jgi:hypothetical protein
MTLAEAKARGNETFIAHVTYDRHLQSSKYFYSTGHRCLLLSSKLKVCQDVDKTF